MRKAESPNVEVCQSLYRAPREKLTALIDEECGRLFNYKVWAFQKAFYSSTNRGTLTMIAGLQNALMSGLESQSTL